MPGNLGLCDQTQSALNTQLSSWSNRFGRHFILGLSGGGDSMALALGCAKWVALGQGQIHAVCVDHGLRDEAAVEARQTLEWARLLGLSGDVEALNLQRGQSRLQQRAREGRHGALVKTAKAAGARVILLAHNLDDQNETVALRLTAKTGLDGLAGMSDLSPSPFYHDDWPCLIGRPLLQVGRKSLREDLGMAGQGWHEDSSNTNLAFARIRTRSRLGLLKGAGADPDALSRVATYAGKLRLTNERAARALLTRARLRIEPVCLRLDLETITTAPNCLSERAIGWLAFAMGSAQRPPESTKSARLSQALKQSDFSATTLSGAKFMCRQGELIVTQAPRRRAQSEALLRVNKDPQLRLHAISGNLDQFVTYLG